jgi:hypothetical protein
MARVDILLLFTLQVVEILAATASIVVSVLGAAGFHQRTGSAVAAWQSSIGFAWCQNGIFGFWWGSYGTD